jgi:hypothetical protein
MERGGEGEEEGKRRGKKKWDECVDENIRSLGEKRQF